MQTMLWWTFILLFVGLFVHFLYILPCLLQELCTFALSLKLIDMGKRIFLLLTGLFVWLVFACAQDVPVGVVVAFKKGNPQELDRYLGEQVDLIIQNETTNADKALVQGTLASFFKDNQVKGFEVNHEGKRGESSFIVGTLRTVKGVYRVNCFFRRIQNKYYIHQIRIDKTEQ